MTRLERVIAGPRGDALRQFIGIRRELSGSANPAPWIAAAHALRTRGSISENVLKYFVEIFVECVTAAASENDPDLRRIRDRMDTIEAEAGLGEDEYWHIDEAPGDWRALDAGWNARADVVTVEYLRGLGFAALAGDLEQHPRAFEDAGTAGRIELWGDSEIDGSVTES